MRSPLLLLLAWLATPAHADALPDPMRPPRPAAARITPAEAAPTLTAVFATGADRRAIVNGRLVRAGDTVDGYAIEDVLDNGVRYRHAGTVRELQLPRAAGSVKKPATATARETSGGP